MFKNNRLEYVKTKSKQNLYKTTAGLSSYAVTMRLKIHAHCDIGKMGGLSFISNRQRRKEGTYCVSELAGVNPRRPLQ
jgi:hypothetical protein